MLFKFKGCPPLFFNCVFKIVIFDFQFFRQYLVSFEIPMKTAAANSFSIRSSALSCGHLRFQLIHFFIYTRKHVKPGLPVNRDGFRQYPGQLLSPCNRLIMKSTSRFEGK
jgi:hypothetical protein